ncbi:MAG TPA: ferritin-like domain-containing protein [Alphaproteobacteria bacterium]|nr:ferritin-like domain-containing protein [Alphaproteobacteria bacterium]
MSNAALALAPHTESQLTAVTGGALPPFRIGSEAHKRAMCSVLLDLFDPYKPSILAWPNLSDDARKRLTDLPFWDVAVETEGYASSRMQAMADTVTDPLIKEAIALNAFEEGRHKLVIRNMLRFYNIPLTDLKTYRAPRNAQWKFICTGYGECFDSFFAFGLFKMAQDSGYFPAELVEVFEPVVHEEGRHIMFFVNWVAYTAAKKSFIPRMIFRVTCLAALVAAAFSRLSLAGVGNEKAKEDNFVVTGGTNLTVGLTPRKLVEVALAEDSRRMAQYDPRLLRPKIMPFLGKLALRLL